MASSAPMNNTRISQILNRLLADKKIRVAELARRINLPQPTIHRIATGACEHPHLSSLKPIADFFLISVEQLKGHEPIAWIDRASKVPLLNWVDLLGWPLNKNNHRNSELILTDANVGMHGYAVKVTDTSMDPVFPRNTLLIADPEKQYKDRSYVIAKLAGHPEPVFRQLLINADHRYLKPLSPDLEKHSMINLKEDDKILGVVVQAKRDCEI